jgi:hypothetical protein
MKDCTVLTNRKRTIVALVHTVAFLGVALYMTGMPVHRLRAGAPASSWVMAAIYAVVAAVLILLTRISGNSTERLYFGMCATSAACGLLRQVAGDPAMHTALYIRVCLLASAAWTAIFMLRAHSATTREAEEPRATAAAAD